MVEPYLDQHLKRLTENKKSIQSKQPELKIEILPKVSTTDIKKGREIALTARQARAFYEESKHINELSRPVMLFYAFEKLANILILNTYDFLPESYSHGLSFRDGNLLTKPSGLFCRLHDCYDSDPSIYTTKYKFRFEDILKNGPKSENEILEMMLGRWEQTELLDQNSNTKVKVNEFDREFMFMYSLSDLARYRVIEWSDIIEGAIHDQINFIRTYLKAIQTAFANWVLNLVTSKRQLFYTMGRMG
jgi:hypothetical protein